MFSGNIAKAWNAGQTTSIGIYTGRIDTDLHMESTTKPQVTVRNQEDNLMQADLRHIVTKEKNTFRVGGQVILWETPTGQFYYETMPRDEELYGLYVHDEYSLTDRVTIDAGARMDRKHINKGIDKYAPTQSTSALIEDKWQKPYYSSGVGVAYQPDNNWLFSFRTSYVEQGTDSYLTTVDDRSLDAEKQWRYEAGIAAQLHPAIRTGLTLFYYDIDNMKPRSVPSQSETIW
jgi:iron complex outermembrane receptor protein